ncbi:MAG: hypothetical protein AB2L13_18005 [Spirochaetota bacterium]
MKKPTYYVAVFGDPDPPEKDTVESGRYHLGISGRSLPGEPGDILLLYCTGNYKGHSCSVPGIGIMLTKDHGTIYYRYLPFVHPISKYTIDNSFIKEDKSKFGNIRFNSHWFFEISRDSFCATIDSVLMSWP